MGGNAFEFDNATPDFWLETSESVSYGLPRACWRMELVRSREGMKYLHVRIEPALTSEHVAELSGGSLDLTLDTLYLAACFEGTHIDRIESWPMPVAFGTIPVDPIQDGFSESETVLLGRGAIWDTYDAAARIWWNVLGEYISNRRW